MRNCARVGDVYVSIHIRSPPQFPTSWAMIGWVIILHLSFLSDFLIIASVLYMQMYFHDCTCTRGLCTCCVNIDIQRTDYHHDLRVQKMISARLVNALNTAHLQLLELYT